MHLTIVRACRIVSFALAAAVGVVALVVLTGWTIGRPALATLGASGVAMNPFTALSLLLLSAALLGLLPPPHADIERTLARGAAAAVALGALAKLAMLGRSNGPDAWLFRGAIDATTPINRMAPDTAVILLLVALAVFVIDVEVRGRRPAQALLLPFALPLTLVVLVGFLFRQSELYGWGAYIPMARATSVCLLALQIAVLAGRVESGVTHIFVAQGAGGVAARRLLLAVIVAPVAAGYLELAGQRRGLYGPEFGAVLFTLSMTGLLSIMVWTTARKMHVVDTARAEMDVRLQTLIRNVPLGIVVLDLDGRVQLCNDAFVELFHYPAQELLGRRVDDLIAPTEDGGETASLTRRGFAGESLRRTTVRRRRDGTLVDVELYVVPLAMQGRAIGTYGVYRDLTERRKARA